MNENELQDTPSAVQDPVIDAHCLDDYTESELAVAYDLGELTPDGKPVPPAEPAQAPATPKDPSPVVTPPVSPKPVDKKPVEEKPGKDNKKPKKAKKRIGPPWIIRTLLQMVSVFLCLLLVVSLLATSLLLDFRTLTSSDTINTLITSILSGSSSGTTEQGDNVSTQQIPDSAYLVPLSNPYGDIAIPDNFELPSDILTNPDAISDYLVEIAQKYLDEDADITKEQIQDFMDQSTVTDFVADKVASYIDDALNGTENTLITVDEIMDLLEENEELLAETFDITITEEQKEQIREKVTETVETNDLNGNIREKVNEVMDTPIEGTDMSISDITQMIGTATSWKVILLGVAICLVLMGLLLLCNYYRLPMGITWISMAICTVGALLAIPTAVLQFSPGILAQLLPELSSVANIINSFIGQFALLHYGLLAAGLVLNILGIVLNILWLISYKRKKRALKKNK